jgi:hypothetical protein
MLNETRFEQSFDTFVNTFSNLVEVLINTQVYQKYKKKNVQDFNKIVPFSSHSFIFSQVLLFSYKPSRSSFILADNSPFQQLQPPDSDRYCIGFKLYFNVILHLSTLEQSECVSIRHKVSKNIYECCYVEGLCV